MDIAATPTHLRIEQADEVWDRIEACLERYAEAWQSEIPPDDLRVFVHSLNEAERRLALVEIVKLDLEYRTEQNLPARRLEDYLAEMPEIREEDIPADLIYEEYHVRWRSGENVEASEYFRRFPQQRDQLQRLFSLNAPEVSTAVFGRTRVADFEPGQQIDDFDLLLRLGKGAFATVYLARQRSLQRMVALKVSADHGTEPQTLAQLDHPNIVRVFDQRSLPDRDTRLLYMKYVSGGTLHEVVDRVRRTAEDRRDGQLVLRCIDEQLDLRGESTPTNSSSRRELADMNWWQAVCWLGAQLADALDYAHAQKVLHRDLKPANVMLTAEGLPQLVDFNVSFCSKLDGASPAAFFGGSLAYMSPEQLEACNPDHTREPSDLDGTSDTYSLGVILWELLSGRRPFADHVIPDDWPSTLRTMAGVRREGLSERSFSELPKQCPADLHDILARCLAPNPEVRYPTPADLAEDLRLCLDPVSRRIIHPGPRSWAHRLRKISLPMMFVLALLPNALAGMFNYKYNLDHIVLLYEPTYEPARAIFERTQMAINAIAFPLGITIIYAFYAPVATAAHRLSNDPQPKHPPPDWLRRRALRLGHVAALVSVAEWTLAGAVYPLAMRLQGVPLSGPDIGHFLVSLLMCGAVAATYPFFGVTAYSARYLYPPLLAVGRNRSTDDEDLKSLQRSIARVYLPLALLVTMLAIVMLVVWGDEEHRLVLAIICGGSLAGFVLLWLFTLSLWNLLSRLRGVVELLGQRRR